MGLFDSIYVEKKLPLPKEVAKLKINWKEIEFQTKDLECLLSQYKINNRGQLLYLSRETEWAEGEGLFGGYLKTISQEWVKHPHTGVVFFYTTVCSDLDQKEAPFFEFASQEKIDAADGYDYQLEFRAKFVDGKLASLDFQSIDAYPIRQKLLDHNEWVKSVKEKESKIDYKIKSFFKKVLPNRGYYKIINLLNKFIAIQQKLVTKLY